MQGSQDFNTWLYGSHAPSKGPCDCCRWHDSGILRYNCSPHPLQVKVFDLHGKNYGFTLSPTYQPIAEDNCVAVASKTRKNILITMQVHWPLTDLLYSICCTNATQTWAWQRICDAVVLQNCALGFQSTWPLHKIWHAYGCLWQCSPHMIGHDSDDSISRSHRRLCLRRSCTPSRQRSASGAIYMATAALSQALPCRVQCLAGGSPGPPCRAGVLSDRPCISPRLHSRSWPLRRSARYNKLTKDVEACF